MTNASSQFDISLADGGKLAVWVEGEGPPFVLIHGSLGDHTGFAALVDLLRSEFTTYAVDRRGFGASPDREPYSIQREFEDVAAAADAVAVRHGTSVTLMGHSFGANCAMGGAGLTATVINLVLYEPSFTLQTPLASVEAVERQLADGNREAAVRMVLEDQLELDAEAVEAIRQSPRWDVLLAGAHTMPRETRAELEWAYAPGQFSSVGARTLMLAGSDSPPPIMAATIAAAAALPDAVVRVLPGHAHLAHREDPGLVARTIRRFLAEGSSTST